MTTLPPHGPADLTGRVAVVTGSSQGIGRGIALALARAGADLALAARTPDTLDSVREEVEALGRKAIAIPNRCHSRG